MIIKNTTPIPINDIIDIIDSNFYEEHGYRLSQSNPYLFTEFVAKEYTKLHITKCLKTASEKAELCYDEGQCEESNQYSIDRLSIINAYPLDLIL